MFNISNQPPTAEVEIPISQARWTCFTPKIKHRLPSGRGREGRCRWLVGQTQTGRRRGPGRFGRLLVLVAVTSAALLAAGSAHANLNGSFTNNGSGWIGVGPATNAGAPRVVTNSSGATVLQIGTNSPAGVPGTGGAKVSSTGKNVCLATMGSYCAVHFHAEWTPAGTETAKVMVSYRSDHSSRVERTITASGDHVVNLADGCPSQVIITYTIDSKGKPVNSLLEISVVSLSCDTTDKSTLIAQAPPSFDEPRTAAYPLPYGSRANGSLTVSLPAGVSPVANPFSCGSNWLDQVLAAQDATVLYKYNPQTMAFENYYRNGGHWYPENGTLGPGEAAFIRSPGPQEFTITGQYVPLPFGPHPTSGSAFFGNPLPWPVLLEDVTGFKPVVGDVLLMFQHGDMSGAVPSAVDSPFMFQPETFALQPEIPPGETVQVFFADPSMVPLSITRDGANVKVSAPGDLPSDGILQTSEELGARWKSLLGVADFYSEPMSADRQFYRMGFNLPTGSVYGRLTAANGAPMSGASLMLGPNGQTQSTGGTGNFTFTNVPLGIVDLMVCSHVQVMDTNTSQSSFFDVFFPIELDLAAPAGSSNLKQDIVAQVIKPPVCDCVPWCGIVGGTVNGVQKVVAGGGKHPPNCNGQATVTITGPGGVQVNLGQGGRQTFSPAANGTWTVTSTVCGITKTCTITLP